MYNRQNDLDTLIDEMIGSGDGSAKRTSLPLDQIHPFPDHPYQVRDDEEMESLTESVREQGVLTPLLVRRIDGSSREYEVISGHRRLFAAGKAGLKEVPVIVTDMDRASAAIALVDSNLHREHIFPSEKGGPLSSGTDFWTGWPEVVEGADLRNGERTSGPAVSPPDLPDPGDPADGGRRQDRSDTRRGAVVPFRHGTEAPVPSDGSGSVYAVPLPGTKTQTDARGISADRGRDLSDHVRDQGKSERLRKDPV